jgi:hypothetical protein
MYPTGYLCEPAPVVSSNALLFRGHERGESSITIKKMLKRIRAPN